MIKNTVLLLLLSFATIANAEQVCVVDLNADGKAINAGETASCVGSSYDHCPIDAVTCNTNPAVCPLDVNAPCNNGNCELVNACIDNSNYDSEFWADLTSIIEETTTFTTKFMSIDSMTLITTTTPGVCVDGVTFGYDAGTHELGVNVWVSDGCAGIFLVLGKIFNFTCPVTGVDYIDNTTCEQNCLESAACSAPTYECPLNANVACKDNGGVQQCSLTSCFDSTAQPEPTPVDTKKLVNDGARNPDGSCAETIHIFSGKNSTCMTDGVISAFRNCCAEGDGVIQDDYTGLSTIGLVADTASLVYTASTAAWAVYDTALAAGATTAEAGAASSAYFTEVLIANGATIAIGVGIALAAYYYANACPQEDLTTGVLANSKMCHFVGHNCTDRWLGSCVQEEKVYCCFNTKIGRIVHQQGRLQLKSFVENPTGVWGAVDAPNCRGFIPEEFQALDFSRIDLSEYYADVAAAANTINVNQTMTDKITNEVNAIQP